MRTAIIVQNLKCGGCAKTITAKLSEMQNVSDINVNTDTSTVSFYLKNADDKHLIKEKLKTLGYPSIDDDNGVLSKVSSFISCAKGKMTN